MSDRWTSMAEILADADIDRTIELDWKGKKLVLHYKELAAGEATIGEIAMLPETPDGKPSPKDFAEKYDRLVFKMLMKARDENIKEGFPIDENTYFQKMPLVLRMMIFGAITTQMAEIESRFRPSPAMTP